MTLSEIESILEMSGLPVEYRAFPEGAAPPLPYLCYLYTGSRNFCADGVIYEPGSQIRIELYTKIKDPETEDKVERALSSFIYDKSEDYLTDEKCYEIIYEIEV